MFYKSKATRAHRSPPYEYSQSDSEKRVRKEKKRKKMNQRHLARTSRINKL